MSLLASVCVAATVLLSTVRGVQISIEAHEEECFYEELKARDSFSIEFQVKKGGFLDVDLSIEDPTGASLHNAQRQTDGRVTLSAQVDGIHKICFGNKFSSLTVKVIDFEIVAKHKKPATQPLDELDAARAEDVDSIQAALFQLGDGLEEVEKELLYLRGRNSVHHFTNLSTNERVVNWSTFEAFMTIGVSLWQVWYLRRYFEIRRTL